MTSENNTEILTLSDQPSKVNTLSATEDCIELMTRAYAKVILHAAKYPHTAVNGVLLAKLPAKGGLIIRDIFKNYLLRVLQCPCFLKLLMGTY